MRVTKKIEKELLAVMDDYWGSYFQGDLQSWAAYLPDDYRNIGTTKAEIWNSKKEIVDFTERIIDQTVGMAEVRNKKTQIIPYDPYVMVHELGDLYVKAEEAWIYYAQFRLSSLLEKTSKGWKILHQHGSFPDAKADEGEAFGFDELKAENKKLRDAIKARTIELEHKNRDLEVEAALERVRTVAMSMRTPAELQRVGEVIFTELKALGFSALRNTEIIINQDEKQSILSYYYSDYGVSGKIEVDYASHPVLKKWAEDMKTAGDGFASVHISEEEMEGWKQYRLDLGYPPDPKLESARFLDYYSYSTGLGALSISSFKPISEEQLTLLERFRNVFGLAYRRYADVLQAEVQAKEAQIEAALERVRSRTMAMHKSDELLESGALLFKELSKLDVKIFNCGYVLMDDQEKMGWNYGVNPGDGTIRPLPTGIPQSGTKILEAITESWKKQEPLLVIELNPQETIEHQTYVAENMPNFSLTKEQLLAISPEWLVIQTFNFKHGYLLLVDGSKLTTDQQEMVMRFAKVFEMTYRRFLDLQKAEAQTREAQIEAALERTRTQSILMQHSDELNEVSNVFHEQLLLLGLPSEFSYVWLPDEKNRTHMFWATWSETTNGGAISRSKAYTYPLDKTEPYTAACYEMWESDESVFVNRIKPEEVEGFFSTWAELVSEAETLKAELFPDGLYYAEAYMKYGCFGINIRRPLSEEEQQVLLRFSVEFERAYTRFLDLLKAEAQTREAQIEAAVERVRAAAMSMHSSKDFSQVNEILWEQVKNLEVTGFAGAGILLFDENDHVSYWDFSSAGNIGQHEHKLTHYNYKKYPLLGLEIWDAYQKGEPYYLLEYDLPRLKKAEKEWASIDPAIAADFEKAIASGQLTYQWGSCGLITNGFLTFDHLEQPDEDAKNIMVKIAGAFDLAYQRFLDLQKAEAQAREAQIEAALEKVRSRSLAMHKSDELNEVVAILFEKLKELQIPATAVGIAIPIDGSKDFNAFVCGENEAGLVISNYRLPFFENIIAKELYHAFEKQLDLFVGKYSKEEKNAFYEYLFEHSAIRDVPDDIKSMIFESPSYTITMVAVKNALFNINDFEGKLLSENEVDIIKRFSKVFDQAYIRFLDLQKAEAQAREKEIELGLERVRARAMAMRKSEELADLVKTVFDELTKLDFAMKWCMINIIDEATRDNTIWAVNPDVDKAPESYDIRFGDWPYHQASFKAYQERKTKFVYVLEGKEKVDFEEFMFNETDVAKISEEAKKATRAMKRYVHSYSFCDFGGLQTVSETPLSEESLDILARFGKVFDLTYTRFNDLKLAEAQAREAQIEVALEKVRSRTMAMHSSEELEEVVAVVAEKLQDLGIILDANGVILCTYFKDSRDVMHWIAAPDFSGSGRYLLPYFDHPIFSAAWESKLSGDDYFSKAFSVEEKNSFFEYAFKHSDYKHFPEEFKEWVFQNDKHSLSFAWSENSAILIPSHTGVVPSEIDQEILKRFAKVFEQAYVRFMDLQTKEEQAAKIAEEKQRLEKTLYDLQTTQKQLIQSEKMASLGELTAGIAHEIQNPLNFVNNFSEVSNEILDEMLEEIEKGDFEEVKAIASDIRNNLEKINHHGKRADAIVKGMLQHSRQSTGEKTPTDINQLADEYLRLAYHGLRAKDKTFNAKLNTNFDPTLEKVMVIPQDLGRVVLNLVTNAFYAVQEKQKHKNNGYEPTVSIRTEKSKDHLTITVKDNGNGIPQQVVDKIFQPFFTTKPTGQGTGLGLSLAFDIITKGHDGKLDVKTEEGVGSIFTIIIPKNA